MKKSKVVILFWLMFFCAIQINAHQAGNPEQFAFLSSKASEISASEGSFNEVIDSLFIAIFLETCGADRNEYFTDHGDADTLVVFSNGEIISDFEMIALYIKTYRSTDRDSIANYLDFFISFRMKIFEGLSMGMDESAEFKTEIKGYALQSAKDYKDNPRFKKIEDFTPVMDNIKRLAMEYHDGILLFDLTDQKIWSRAINDTEGLQAFYNSNKSQYPNGFDNQKGKITADYQNYLEGEWTAALKNKYNPSIKEQAVLKLGDKIQSKLETPSSAYTPGDERKNYDLRASHILIKLDENAVPSDTLAAYHEIMGLRDRILAGAEFGDIASAYSDDPSAQDHNDPKSGKLIKGNHGDLGYFTASDMVAPFEAAAYNTPVGQVSMPVRTKFGYHLIKVTDRRPTLGRVAIAHIFVKAPADQDQLGKQEAKDKIYRAYSELQDGARWADVVNQYSEDKGSAAKAGELASFKVNRMVPELVVQVYDLKEYGQFSQPFETNFGWHIIRLLERENIGVTRQAEDVSDIAGNQDNKYNAGADTEAVIDNGIFTDTRNEISYKVITIGGQTWFAENLNFRTASGSWCHNDDASACAKYGRFYNWETAKSVCPPGWHLPSMGEFTTLFENNGNVEETVYTKLITGGESGFNAIFSGARRPDGGFDATGYWTAFWSSSVVDGLPVYFAMSNKIRKAMLASTSKEGGFSIRCLKNEKPITTNNESNSGQLVGYWRVLSSKNGSILVSNDPTSEILQFKSDGIIDLQIESIKYSRGRYSLNNNQVTINFNHMSNSVTYNLKIDNSLLILENSSEEIVLQKAD